MAFYNETSNIKNFVISFSGNPKTDFPIFAKGYFLSASKLAAELQMHPFKDYEAYPIVFLYRHSLELYLKGIIYNSFLIKMFKGDNDLEYRLKYNHDIKGLSSIVYRLLLDLFPEDKDLEVVAKKICVISAEFSEIDPASYSYRYPIDKKGGDSTNPHQLVNLESLSNSMNELLEDLDTINFGLNIEKDIAQDQFEILDEFKRLLNGN